MSLLFQFCEDRMSGFFKVMAHNTSANQVRATSLNMHGLTRIKLERYFMAMSLLFHICEDCISGFGVMANNVSASQVLAASFKMHQLA